ncbi:MAG: hypothetical protein GY737_18315 [Desulfobacteraceae bacterium]|nr:hypothetical protein [Desulfobacteraceae bacterium]
MPLPVAHSAVGAAVYFSVPAIYRNEMSGIRRWLLFGCLVFLANAPDLDFLPGLLINQPNRFHHGASHSLACMAVLSLGGWFMCHSCLGELPGRILMPALLVASVSHIILDFFSFDGSVPYGVPLLWPFSAEYYVCSFPFFREVMRSGNSNALFFQTLINENNLWEITIEFVFFVFLLSMVRLKREPFKSGQYLLPSSIAAVCLIFWYSVQIEPNWIKVNECELKNEALTHKLRMVHLSDLHLNRISFREKRVKYMLEREILPDVLVFTGDTFDPFGEDQKITLSHNLKKLVEYISGLPGEKFLVWGEGICNNRHQLSRLLSSKGVTVLEDGSAVLKNHPGLTITGKLPELADFSLTPVENSTTLTAGSTFLNSFIHFHSEESRQFKNYEFTGDFFFSSDSGGMGLTFYSQYTPLSDRFYRIRWSGNNPEPAISSHGTGQLSGKLISKIAMECDTLISFKLRGTTNQVETVLKAKFWERGTPEPDDWNIRAFDRSGHRLKCGTVGVWVNGPAGQKRFDNFKVISLDEPMQVLVNETFEDDIAFRNLWRTERVFRTAIFPQMPGKINILLSHSPEIIDDYELKNFDLILTGDTHGGQVCWPWKKPVFRNMKLQSEWYSGLHFTRDQQMIYINKGIGTSRIPMRLFCRPEIAVFNYEI